MSAILRTLRESGSPSAASPFRRLGGLAVLAIGVNAIVGSGVFSLPDDMARAMGGWSPFAYLLCALLLMPVAMCFAELAERYEGSGGPYLYATEAFGTSIGFAIGWSCWLNSFLAWAANTTLFVELCGLAPGPLNKLVVAGTIVLLGGINYIGVRPGSWVIQAVVVGKLAAIFCFLGVGLTLVDTSALGGALDHGARGVASGTYLALFPLQGFEVVPVPAGEAKNARRNVPFAIVGSLLFSALLFIVVQGVLVGSYGSLENESITPLVDAAYAIGPTIGLIVFVGSVVSIGGFTAGSALGSPRYAQAIAEHGQLPPALAKTHARFATPHVAIVVTTAATVLLGLAFDYRTLVGMSNLTVVMQYAATCVAVLVLRRRDGVEDSRYRVPGGPILPIVGAVGSIGLAWGATADELVVAIPMLVLGGIVAVWTQRSRSGR